MNANELADALDWVCENHLVGIGDADFKATATMLRQQQAEIEALKMGFANNGTSDSELAEVRALANRQFLKIEALKLKKVTEGEILNIYLCLTNGNKDLDLFEFAEEILKKAQE